MSGLTPCQLIVSQSKPSIGRLPVNFRGYIVFQPVAGEAPTALYYVDTLQNHALLHLVAEHDIDKLITETVTTITKHKFPELYELTEDEQEKLAEKLNFSPDKTKIKQMVIDHRTGYGLTASNIGNPLNLDSSANFVFQGNLYNDGNGDIGNLIDVTKHVIEYNQSKAPLGLHFVLTASNRIGLAKSPEEVLDAACDYFIEELTVLLKKYPHISFDIKNNIFRFAENPPSFAETSKNDYELSTLICSNPTLARIYENADAVFTIATPFQEIPTFLRLKPTAQLINITEHAAASPWFHRRWSIPEVHHYITGFKPLESGLMVEDFSCDLDGSVRALQSIEDEDYLSKLGLAYPVSTQVATKFLQETLVVPVYLGKEQQALLATLVYMAAQSPLAQRFKKIVFHINQRSYDHETFQVDFKWLEQEYGSCSDRLQFIVGHFFKNNDDLCALYQLSSGVGLAIISSDKVLELAISCNLLPIYPPVEWKRQVSQDFCEFVKDNDDYLALNKLLFSLTDKACCLPTQSISKDDLSLLNPNVYEYWANKLRPLLLERSFYRTLQTKILGNKVELTPVSNNRFFGDPMQLISKQITAAFSIPIRFAHINPQKALVFSTTNLNAGNDIIMPTLINCEAELVYTNTEDKHRITIENPEKIRQFLVEIGFNPVMVERLCTELNIAADTPARPEESDSCSLR